MSAQAPRALRVEWQTDPIGLGTRWPRFFWQLEPGAFARQSAYELLVARDGLTRGGDQPTALASRLRRLWSRSRLRRRRLFGVTSSSSSSSM